MTSNRGRTPKAVGIVEQRAAAMWLCVRDFVQPEIEQDTWSDVSARLFGMGEVLLALKQKRAADTAFFLSSLSGHLAMGDLTAPVQGGA